MNRAKRWITVLGVAALLGGCSIYEPEEIVGPNGGSDNGSLEALAEINPSVMGTHSSMPRFATGRLATRPLIDQTTVAKMEANFLRIDEDINTTSDDNALRNRGLYTFASGDDRFATSTNWEKAYLAEAHIMSAPDDSDDHLRGAWLDPVQSYKIRVETHTDANGEIIKDTTDFYHTRMVTWYPKNCILDRTANGTAAITRFDNSRFDNVRVSGNYDADGDGHNEEVVAVQFRGLDGQTDVMVSDVREGQHWHFEEDNHPSDFVPAGHPWLPEGEKIYREPFGHFYQPAVEGVQREVNYRNFFTYKHYLSAVRVFAYAEQSSQNLLMWGQLEKVTIANQPTSVKVTLPTAENSWGKAYDWADRDVVDIVCSPIYGEDDVSGEMPETVTYPISTKDSSEQQQIYLGYALIEPEAVVQLQLHTSAGVYQVKVNPQHIYTDDHGVQQVADVFKAGYIYNIHLNLRTDGTIAAILENESNELYYDLTRLTTYENPEPQDGDSPTTNDNDISLYRYSNCYIVSPLDNIVKDSDGNIVLDEQGNPRVYDGYCFSATTIGNGQGGIISSGAQTMYPTSARISPQTAHLLWESELGLVSQVELLYGYVRFKVPDKTKEGNAVIAVYDKDGNTLWSWHIWITDPPREQVFDNGTRTITLLDRNLGATADKWTTGDPSTALPTYGLYYQWGRKDPSMGPLTYNYFPTTLITQPYYDYSSHERRAAEVVQFPRPSLQNAVENPMFLILPSEQTQSYYYNWSYELYDFLWGYDPDTGTMVKTIYDPCPFGYRVPLGEMGTIFAEDGYSTFETPNANEYGQKFTNNGETFYFPFAGFKGVDVGLQSLVLAWRYVGEKGDYMSSWVSKDTGNKYNHRARLYISREREWTETNVGTYSAYRHDDFTNRRTAGSVRCVKNDTPMGVLEISLTPSQTSVQENDNLKLYCKGNSAETHIVYARVTVRSLDPDTPNPERVLYETPEGKVETNETNWAKTIDFYTGMDDGEFFSSYGYVFELTCINNLGVSSTVHTSVNYHSLTVDLSKWESAEQNETPLPSTDFSRVVHVMASENPAKVEVIYDDENGVEQNYDITSTEYDSTLPSEGYASNKGYYHVFNFSKAGTYPVKVRVTCGYHDETTEPHIKEVNTTVVVYDYLQLQLINKTGRYFWMSNTPADNPHTVVNLAYRAESVNADITSQSIAYTDGYAANYGVALPLDPDRPDKRVSEGEVNVELSSNSSLDYTLHYSATDELGVARSTSTRVGFIGLDKSGWKSVGVVGRSSWLGLRLFGGGVPKSVILRNEADNVQFTMAVDPVLDNTGNTIFLHDATWAANHTFQYVGQQSFNLIVTLEDEQGNDVVLPIQQLLLDVYLDLDLEMSVSHKYLWKSELATLEGVTVSYSAKTNNEGASMASSLLLLDSERYAAGSAENIGNQNIEMTNVDITSAVQAATDGRLNIQVVATDSKGVERSEDDFIATLDLEFAPDWSNERPADMPFERTLNVVGGDVPTSVTVGETPFTRTSIEWGNVGEPFNISCWSGNFTFPEGVYSELPVVLTFEDGTTLTYNYAPTLNVTKKIEPIDVSIAVSHSEIFFGAKNTNATLNVSAFSPNGNLTEVTVTTSDGLVLYSGNPASPSWSNAALAYTPTVGAKDKTFTIHAVDKYGTEATATVTADVYRVTLMESFSNLDTSSVYLIENTEYINSYVRNSSGTTLATTGLSSAAFVTLSGSGSSYSVMFNTSRYISISANWNSASVSAGTSQTRWTFTDNGTNMSMSYQANSWRTYYFKQTGNNSFGASTGTNGNYTWHLYRVTTD